MQVTVIFGSNSGNKIVAIQKAIEILQDNNTHLLKLSSVYETEPWGFESDEMFYNCVGIYETSLSPENFMKKCLETEKILGRIRPTEERYASRTIDIDILFYNSLVLDTNLVKIPHPRIAQRRFVLTPLNEIMPDFTHPVLHKTISELLLECPDKLEVKKVENIKLV